VKGLNRESIAEAAPFGSPIHVAEELIAEISAAYLCAEAGISPAVVENQAACVEGWLAKRRNDKANLERDVGLEPAPVEQLALEGGKESFAPRVVETSRSQPGDVSTSTRLRGAQKPAARIARLCNPGRPLPTSTPLKSLRFDASGQGLQTRILARAAGR
jgi:zincin-like metallopeptidase